MILYTDPVTFSYLSIYPSTCVFGAIVSRIVFKVSKSSCSLLVYREVIGFRHPFCVEVCVQLLLDAALHRCRFCPLGWRCSECSCVLVILSLRDLSVTEKGEVCSSSAGSPYLSLHFCPVCDGACCEVHTRLGLLRPPRADVCVIAGCPSCSLMTFPVLKHEISTASWLAFD